MGQLQFYLEVMKWLARDKIRFTAATSDAFIFYGILCAKGKVFEII